IYSIQLPENPSENLRPVLVWIHGGGYAFGSGNIEQQGPDYLLEEDIVVVTLNYRLGALGFLSLQGTEVSSNNGLKDQSLALRWVQQNIAHFGGDPSRVTIWGESAGAGSVHGQMLSPMSQGDFIATKFIDLQIDNRLMWKTQVVYIILKLSSACFSLKL
ncbi:Esterase E4, partial [Blattella germanica]